MHTDLSFITNEQKQSLKERFNVLIKDTAFFDCLVGYFYLSGFHTIYPALEKTEKIRILIGIGTDSRTFQALQEKDSLNPESSSSPLSHPEVKGKIETLVKEEMENSEDTRSMEEGTKKFIEWINSGKLEIRVYPSQKIHAKIYIMTFREGDRDTGRVITGSSNFTQSGLVDNLEFNVELKNRSDYEFSRQKFEELWQKSVDVSERYVTTLKNETWLNQNISPYELYLKFLYEYFKDQLNQTGEIDMDYLPQNFRKLAYQQQAVLNAKKILLEYGGVFISDVVGLGKTYIAAMLAKQFDDRTLVIAPPFLIDKDNPGSWYNVFAYFNVSADYESIGKLDDLKDEKIEKYKIYRNIIIDEAHRFRTEQTITYENLAKICRGKRVILVTATPYNNSPRDILSLIKLFQNARKSTIPNVPDLESFFSRLENRLKNLDRKENYTRYIATVKENAREIRDRILKYLMVRRTRSEIEKYFSEDLKEQGLKFPRVEKPVPFFYELNEKEDKIFNETIQLLARKLTYARYTSMLYHKEEMDELTKQSQRNMGSFMKILLVKRLESSFFAFKKSIERFIHSYEMFLREYEKGSVYVSAKHINKIFEFLEEGDDKAIEKLLEEGKAEKYDSKDFKEELKKNLENDIAILRKIQDLWQNIDRDPKLLKFFSELDSNPVLQNNHLLIFTESKETAHYLYENLNKKYPGAVLLFTGDSNKSLRERVIENFDANAIHKKDTYRILIATEVLSEGVNLHRANVVINYDIPWNPTRMMQRVGRINRVDTPFDTIYTFNFFPTTQSNDHIKLREAAETKINAFLTLLGGDAELLTEGEPIGSHELFDRLTSQKTLEGDEDLQESELKYLNIIKDIRQKDPYLFDRIKKLPKKARTAKKYPEEVQKDAQDTPNHKELLFSPTQNACITYFRRGKLQKFFLVKSGEETAREIDFITAARILESTPDEKKITLPEERYDMLDKNKQAFLQETTEETSEPQKGGGRDSAYEIRRILKACLQNTQQLTEEQEAYLRKVLERLEEGAIIKSTIKKTLRALNNLSQDAENPLTVLNVLRSNISDHILKNHYAEENEDKDLPKKREVILSLYLTHE
ncbi:helicase-related protein [Thermospira aquatica]|uniref:Helicase n=1 Tax=Thermospira aquatica TaxID=2828656 RepID=A0AAX3BF18_9SPIR|nr:helicase-related protein [Thermospira aquatica]URA10892.1 hypothetical protein KDW03_03560 [Thermospira aquatica]